MLAEWKLGVKYVGFCSQIRFMNTASLELNIKDLPELWAQKPKCNYRSRSQFHSDKRRTYTSCWWEPYSAAKRIEALEKAIRMVRPLAKRKLINSL